MTKELAIKLIMNDNQKEKEMRWCRQVVLSDSACHEQSQLPITDSKKTKTAVSTRG